MNIRLDALQIRLRLDPPDVEMLAGGLPVSLACALSAPGFCVTLLHESSIARSEIRWHAERGLLEIALGLQDFKQLLDPAQEALTCDVPGAVALLIEKDRRSFAPKKNKKTS